MFHRSARNGRRGSVIFLVVILLVAMFMFVAFAIDIGLMVLARNHAQIVADTSALAGVRQLDGITDTATANAPNANNKATAKTFAEKAALENNILGAAPLEENITVTVGSYYYKEDEEKFIHDPDDRPNTSEAWGAVQVKVEAERGTFFARIFGYDQYSVNAMATSVHRPRDVALILDFSGSMRFSSSNAITGSSGWDTGMAAVSNSLNPDPAIPNFGHWASYQGVPGRLCRVTDVGSQPYLLSPSNWTKDSADSGPAIIKDFEYDPDQINYGDAFDPSNMANAFHNPQASWSKSGTPPSATVTVTPAPDDNNFRNQSAGYAEGGDVWPHRNATTNAANATLGGTPYARSVSDFLRGNHNDQADHAKNAFNNTANSITGYPGGNAAGPGVPPDPPYRGWEEKGYDMDQPGRFKGYSMGPGYYGKTFFMWPPDPRAPVGTDPTAMGYVAGDWRRRFFTWTNSSNFPDNDVLFNDAGTRYLNTPSGTTFQVNYPAILAWIKQEPHTLPINLRAGRILYYTHIPSDVTITGAADTEEERDKLFWRSYIDYVIGNYPNADRYMYGLTTQAFNANNNVRTRLRPTNGTATPTDDPYMNYTDCPRSPLMHFWFGPLTMLDFINPYNRTADQYGSWMPGTAHEAQSWQLKVGVNSALDDIEKNHPNDWVSLIYFSDLMAYNVARVNMGKDYKRMKNALFYPFNMLDSMATATAEWRPYNDALAGGILQDRGQGLIPHADGSTCPAMGLMVAYNQFSTRRSPDTPAFNGRKGANKVCILETDGIPNTSVTGTPGPHGTEAYKYYYTITGTGGGGATQAVNVSTQICALDTASPPGYTSGSRARVHAIAFGDLFDDTGNDDAQVALNFLYEVQREGNTSPATRPALPYIQDYKVVAGRYVDTPALDGGGNPILDPDGNPVIVPGRISKLRTALERIMQSGVQVTLIKGEGEYIMP